MSMMQPDSESLIDAYVRGVFAANQEGAHTYDHTRRVYRIALEIGRALGANLRVLGAAALLHDIGRMKEKELGISHAVLSGQMGREALKRAGYTDEEVEEIVEAIRTHRFSEGLVPTTLEGKILSDADKLDAIGAIGVYRAIAQSVVNSRGPEGFLKHADEKLLRLKDLMFTEPARELAQERHRLLSAFVEQLRQEISEA